VPRIQVIDKIFYLLGSFFFLDFLTARNIIYILNKLLKGGILMAEPTQEQIEINYKSFSRKVA